jgi:hypothetical protein
MYLYEEYAKRFLISSPIIKRCDKSVVFLRSNQILMIEKKLNFNQPDSYKLSICIPNKHNNHNFSFFKVLFCEEIEWNNYEKIILDLCYKNNEALENYEEIFIRSWEVFLSYNDFYFSKNINFNILYQTIDFNNENRIKDIEGFILYLKNNNDYYYEMWLDMNKVVDNYSYWLAKLINSKSCY